MQDVIKPRRQLTEINVIPVKFELVPMAPEPVKKASQISLTFEKKKENEESVSQYTEQKNICNDKIDLALFSTAK